MLIVKTVVVPTVAKARSLWMLNRSWMAPIANSFRVAKSKQVSTPVKDQEVLFLRVGRILLFFAERGLGFFVFFVPRETDSSHCVSRASAYFIFGISPLLCIIPLNNKQDKTACILSLCKVTGTLRASNLGDSAFL